MGGDSEYEPRDSRNITGEASTPDGHFSGDRGKPGHGGEYEPRDSRNVTGTAATPDKRWTNEAGRVPRADGSPGTVSPGDVEPDEDSDAGNDTGAPPPPTPPVIQPPPD